MTRTFRHYSFSPPPPRGCFCGPFMQQKKSQSLRSFQLSFRTGWRGRTDNLMHFFAKGIAVGLIAVRNLIDWKLLRSPSDWNIHKFREKKARRFESRAQCAALHTWKSNNSIKFCGSLQHTTHHNIFESLFGRLFSILRFLNGIRSAQKWIKYENPMNKYKHSILMAGHGVSSHTHSHESKHSRRSRGEDGKKLNWNFYVEKYIFIDLPEWVGWSCERRLGKRF